MEIKFGIKNKEIKRRIVSSSYSKIAKSLR